MSTDVMSYTGYQDASPWVITHKRKPSVRKVANYWKNVPTWLHFKLWMPMPINKSCTMKQQISTVTTTIMQEYLAVRNVEKSCCSNKILKKYRSKTI